MKMKMDFSLVPDGLAYCERCGSKPKPACFQVRNENRVIQTCEGCVDDADFDIRFAQGFVAELGDGKRVFKKQMIQKTFPELWLMLKIEQRRATLGLEPSPYGVILARSFRAEGVAP
jgi:hypothetical protein